MLYESGLHRLCQPVIVIFLPTEQQIARTLERDKSESTAVKERIKAQMSTEEKAARANVVIDNSGSIEQLQRKVQDVVQQHLRSTYP